MAPPSKIAIATSVLNRLVKDEASYHKEYDLQQASIAKLEAGENADDENAEFQLKQEVGGKWSCTVNSLSLSKSTLCTLIYTFSMHCDSHTSPEYPWQCKC